MNIITKTNTTEAPTSMTSREIAELTGKRHDNVLRDIHTMLDALEITGLSFEDSYLDTTGRTCAMFRLPKDLTMTLVSGYNVVMRHRIVTRWQALEIAESSFGSSYRDAVAVPPAGIEPSLVIEIR